MESHFCSVNNEQSKISYLMHLKGQLLSLIDWIFLAFEITFMGVAPDEAGIAGKVKKVPLSTLL